MATQREQIPVAGIAGINGSGGEVDPSTGRRQVLAGIAAGLALALVISQLAAAGYFGLRLSDRLAMGAPTTLMVAVAFSAGWLAGAGPRESTRWLRCENE